MRNHRIPVKIDGVQYESIIDACRALGLSYKTVQSRRYVNKSETEQFSNICTYKRKNYNTPISVRGKNYKSIYAMCKDLNLNYPAICSRLQRGIDVETAVSKPCISCTISDHIIINGVEYTSIHDMAVKTKVKTATFFYNLTKDCETIRDKQNKIQQYFDSLNLR